MGKYYNVKAQFTNEPDEKGKRKKTTESYLVEAMSPTDGEARTLKFLTEVGETRDFEIIAAVESKIVDVISVQPKI